MRYIAADGASFDVRNIRLTGEALFVVLILAARRDAYERNHSPVFTGE